MNVLNISQIASVLVLYFLTCVWGGVAIVAQPNPQWDSDCAVANDGDCGGWNTPPPKKITLADPDCYATINDKYRTCTKGGVTSTDIVVTGWTLIQGCEGWDVKSLFHVTSDGLKDYVKLGLLSSLYASTAKNCDGSEGTPETIANVYTAACGVWTCCEYEITWPQTPVCDPYWTGPPPHSGEPKKVKACK